MTYCLNLSEILNPELLNTTDLEKIIEKATSVNKWNDISRIYIGSNFCSQYFIKILPYLKKLLSKMANSDYKVTLSVPIFTQKNLEKAKKGIIDLIETGLIDEITVNDLGMLNFLKDKNIKINLGRLFFKDTRDVRVPDLYNETTVPNGLSFKLPDNISGIELDPDSKTLNFQSENLKTKEVSVHFPYCYMTTGNICKFGSISKDIKHKFRPNPDCSMECRFIHEFFTEKFDKENVRELFRFGRTIYFLNDEVDFVQQPDRLIYFPLKELANVESIV